MNTLTLTPLNPGPISPNLTRRLTGLAALGVLLLAGVAHAATLTVLNDADNGPGSLRQAIADAQPGDDIVFDALLTGQTIALSTSLTINKNLTISGFNANGLIISGNGAVGVLSVGGGADVLVAGLGIVNGVSSLGGGVIISGGSSLTVVNSTISGNSGTLQGGGIYNGVGSSLTVVNSTISGNSTTGQGGGVYNAGVASLTVVNSTISANSAAGEGGGVFSPSSFSLYNSIVAGNIGSQGPDIFQYVVPLTSNGGNFIGNIAGILSGGVQPTDKTFASTGIILDGLLSPLADNGGPTLTHALVAGSPAIDAGINTDAVDQSNNPLATDQRGYFRIINGTVDIGAFEYGSTPSITDTDGDGVPDALDLCPDSDLRPTVWIGGCDSGVSNDIDGAPVDADGCSLADYLAHQLTTAATGARNHGRFVSTMARYLNALVRSGIITGAEHEALMSCIGSANRSDFLLP